jgi:hypothetical protein
MRRFPFPLPNGWFNVAYADELPRGARRTAHYFGRDLVVARDERGEVGVREAGDLRWPALERNGVVWTWHHARGSAPGWEVPEIPEYGDPDWTDFERLEWKIHTRNQEIAENTSDPAHFRVVHGMPFPDAEISFEGHRFRSSARWKERAADGSLRDGSLEVDWRGLGIGITRSVGQLRVTFLGTITPIDDSLVHMRFAASFRRFGSEPPPRALRDASLREMDRQARGDIPIWENKVFREQPLLCDGDGPIAAFRRWAAQFYSS